MAGTRKDGILLVDDPIEGSGEGVQGDVIIISPIGSLPSTSSVSVAIASDQLPLPVDLNGSGPVDVTITNTPLPISGNVSIGNTVTIAQPVIVTSTDLDVRDLLFASDKVDVSGSNVVVSGTAIVSATDLDIRNLLFATDKVDVSGSSVGVSGTVTVSGNVLVSNFPATQPVSATDLDIRNLVFATDKVDISGSSISISDIIRSNTSTVTSVADTTVLVTLLSAKAARKGYKFFNDSASVAYVKEGPNATTLDYSYKIHPDWFYESVGAGIYTGIITCVWSYDAGGYMKVTELE